MWRFVFGLLPFVVCTYMLGEAQTSPATAPPQAPPKPVVKKAAPAPFKSPQVVLLSGFCDGSDKPLDATKTCPAGQHFFQAQNAASIAASLQKVAKFSSFRIRADGESRLVITCQDGKTCTADQFKTLEAAASAAARRNTVQVPTGAADKSAKIAERFHALHPEIDATSIGTGQAIELASNEEVRPYRAEIDAIVAVTLRPVEVRLPTFCIGRRLTGPAAYRMPVPPPVNPCGGALRVQANNASQIEKALSADPGFSVKADGNSKVLVVCKAACIQADFYRIEDTISRLAWPSPTYVQDVEVPAGTAGTTATKIGKLNLMGITADAIGGDTVRLKSDSPVSGKDVDRIMEAYLFGDSAPPEFRMFYQDAGDVIKDIAPPAKSSTGSGNSSDSSSSSTPASKSSSTDNSSNADSSPSSSDSSQKNSTVVKFSTTSGTSTSVKNGASQQGQNSTQDSAPPGGKAAPGSAADPAGKSDQPPAGPVTETTSNTTVTFTPPPAAPKSSSPPTPVTGEMTVFKDNVVFTSPSDDGLTAQRIRLLTLLDLPRPEVLMNMWSFQASSSDGRETLKGAEKLRDLVTAYNNSLENSIQYGWTYLSRQMKADPLNRTEIAEWPQGSLHVGSTGYLQVTSPLPEFLPLGIVRPPQRFFNREFYNYITQKFVYDRHRCAEPGCNDTGALLPDNMRTEWGFCPAGKYCLGFPQAFQPVRPNLTSILMGAIASEYPLKTILTTIGCMEGKYEVYGPDCFPDRAAFRREIQMSRKEIQPARKTQNDASWRDEIKCRETEEKDESVRQEIHDYEQEYLQLTQQLREQNRNSQQPCQECVTRIEKRQKEILEAIANAKKNIPCPDCQAACRNSLNQAGSQARKQADTYYQEDVERERLCIKKQRQQLIKEKHLRDQLSCELLDTIAVEAQERCGVPQMFPLSCFTIQAAQSFSSPPEVSTFTLEQLNALAEERLADIPVPEGALPGSPFSTTRIGLLRAAVADFLFNYKMSQEFPKEFVPYDLQHSAQELNAELNPLVVAFNQDVAAFSRNLQNRMEVGTSRKDFVSDGIITVRGIGGDPSSVDTLTQNFFDATQPVSLSDVVTALTGQGGGSNQSGGSASSAGASTPSLLTGAVNSATLIPALAALVPKPTEAKIGRQLSLAVTPHTLPGASSAELDLALTAGEDADPTLYQSGKNIGLDNVSRVAKHNVTTRVRVESVKMFEVSSFSALLQRPRSKFPLLPPFVQLPGIGSLASLPLPAAKEYHRSSAIVSAVIVPTAADLAYGIDYSRDRLITGRENDRFGHNYEMKRILSLSEVPGAPVRAFHKAMVSCFATNGLLPFPGGAQFDPRAAEKTCGNLTFASVPPEK